MKDLDRWIAEEVMGQVVVEGYNPCGGPYLVSNTHQSIEYTTDLNLAFAALKKSMNGAYYLKALYNAGVVEYHVDTIGKEIVKAKGKTDSEAICKCIYKLKTGKDWE